MMSKHVIAFSRDRLSASDMLQVRKVMEHVYEKIINLDNESQTTSSSNNEKPEQEKEEDIAVLAEEKIELLCQDQVSDELRVPVEVPRKPREVCLVRSSHWL